MNTYTKIRDHLASRTMGNVLQTVEEDRALLDMRKACDDEGYGLHIWDYQSGVQKVEWNADKTNLKRTRLFLETNEEWMIKSGCSGDPVDVLLRWLYTPAIMQFDLQGKATGKISPPQSWVPHRTAVVVMDGLDLTNPLWARHIKYFLAFAGSNSISLFFLGPDVKVPKELERDLWMIESTLPSRDDLTPLLVAHAKESGIKINGNTEELLDALAGMTYAEAGQAMAMCNARTKREKGQFELVPAYLEEEKAIMLKKGGILEIMNTDISLDDVGGMEAIKSWFKKRKGAWSKKAREYGLPLPKGVLIFGIQGAGKTHLLKAVAATMGLKLVKLDPGRLFASYVGQSEAMVRSCIQQIEAFGKCILFIDEIDKGFAGMRGSHNGDNGVTRRVIGTFLSWMQDKTSPVMVCATANNLSQLPPELLRRGRWDDVWFADLPTPIERQSIWKARIRYHHRKPEDFDLEALAEATDGWTGAEIEQAFVDAMNEAFYKGTEPDTKLVLSVIPQSTPLSQLMAEDIEALRSWAQGRARSTSSEVPVKQKTIFDKPKKKN